MQEIIKRILEGNFDYESGSLDFSCTKLELSLPKGSVYEGSFHILSQPGQFTNGYISTSDMRMECLTPDFAGDEVEIFYCFHGENMEEGDVIKGAFSVISNHGEYYLPFVVSIEHTVLNSSIGPIKNLFHFANLAKTNWPEALNLFYSSEFERVFVGSDAHYYDAYRALSAHPKNQQNMEEFLMQVNKKQQVQFAVEEERLMLNLAVSGNPYAVTELELSIVRNGWGYTFLNIECEGEFVFTEKEFLSDDDFLGNRCSLPVYVDGSLCRTGNNFGKIHLYNSYVSFEIPVMVKVGEGAAKQGELEKKRLIVQLMKFYQAFRMKKISTGTWLKETGKLVEQLVAMDEKDIAARLFQAQMMITEERKNEAGWLLDYAAERMEQEGMEESELWAYYLYLTTLLHRDEKYVNQVAANVERIFTQNRSRWRVAWLLLYLSEEYNKSSSAKWLFLERQFSHGCTSPVIYIEALHLMNNNPTLLRRLENFELQVLYFGAKQEVLSAEAIEQLLYLSGRTKEYSFVLQNILELLYQKKQDVRILQEICTLLIKGGKTGEKYFSWYQKGVDAQLRITNLYEYYMLSMNRNEVSELPKTLLMYFSYQNNLDYEHSAFLYHYVWQHKEEYGDLFENYRLKIERFVAEQIQREHINRQLAGLYRELLSPTMVTEQTAEHLSRLLFAHLICVQDKRMHKVIVYQPGNLLPAEYNLQNGCVWVSLYGSEYTIAFEDAWGNRFTKSVEYTLEKLMMPGKYLRFLEHYVKNCFGLDVYLCTNDRNESELSQEKKERYARMAASRYVAKDIKQQIHMKLLQYYYDMDDMRSLDEYLENIPSDELTMEERGKVLRYMVLRGKYRTAYKWIQRYEPYFTDAKTLMRLSSGMIQQMGFVEDTVLLAAALHAFRKGKYDSNILEYLARYYNGMSKDMRDIWKTAQSFEVDCYGLSERILVQMLYSGAFVGEKMEIFCYYVSQGGRQEVEEAVLAQCSYEYFVKEKLTESYVFQKIRQAYLRGEEVQKICKLAFLKYYAENKEQIQEEIQPLLETFLVEMLNEKIHLNFFREFKGMEHLLKCMEDKTIIEYRAALGGRARIHYVVLHDNGEAQDYLSEYMHDIYGGVCFKEFVLFFGETLQYYIMEETDAGAQLTESGTLQKSDVNNEAANSKYEMINDMVISKSLQDYDTLDKLLEEYYRREFFNEQLFYLE